MKTTTKLHAVCMVLLVLAGMPDMTALAAASEGKAASAAERPAEKGSAPVPEEIMVRFTVPLFSTRFEEFPVASVDDDPITIKELTQALAASHESRREGEAAGTGHAPGRKKYHAMVNRLVMLRLITHEARNMGLDELPDVKDAIDAYSKQYLRDRLVERALENVKADDAEVKGLYQELAKEFKVKSALFEKDGIAKKASDEISGGKDFDETIQKYVDSREAKVASELEGKYLKRSGLLPEIAQAVSDMKAGSASTPLRIERGWVILKLLDVRQPQEEDPAALQEARQQSLDRQRNKALTEFKRGLLKKYATLNQKLYKKLDYESEDSDFEKLRKDQRVIATIEGEKSLTVGEFTEAIEAKLYHGLKSAREGKTINEKKPIVLNEILSRRLELKEALQQGVDKTADYKDSLKRYEEAVLFNKFIQKVIAPDVNVGEGELRAYYQSHKKEFTRRPMVKLKSLAFKAKKDADTAIARLRKGVDFAWMKANAGGIVTDAPELPAASVPLIVTSLPDGLQKAIEGAREGDFRPYSAPDGLVYVVLVAGMVPEAVQPFETVSQQIKTRVINDEITKSLDEWSAKLRDAYTVRIYLSETEK